MDSELANDRTFLAWLRTAIAVFGLGFVVAKISLIVQPEGTRLENKDLYSTVGVLIVFSGAALVVLGYSQHARVWRVLRGEAPKPRWPLAMTVTSLVACVVLSVLIVVSS